MAKIQQYWMFLSQRKTGTFISQHFTLVHLYRETEHQDYTDTENMQYLKRSVDVRLYNFFLQFLHLGLWNPSVCGIQITLEQKYHQKVSISCLKSDTTFYIYLRFVKHLQETANTFGQHIVFPTGMPTLIATFCRKPAFCILCFHQASKTPLF